jgi:hypothetical protein
LEINFLDIDTGTGLLCQGRDVISRMQLRRNTGACYASVLYAAALILFADCPPNMAQTNSPPPPKRDINAVLAAHDKELLALPDVVGVYVGTVEDRSAFCLIVMLARENRETEEKIPRSIEGYPVRVEVSGKIRPMNAHL